MRIVKTHKAVTGRGINTSIIVGYLSGSQRMNNAKRRRDKTTGALNRDTCKPPRRKRKKSRGGRGVWGWRAPCDGESDVEGRGRSWWTAVALFTLRISLFSRC